MNLFEANPAEGDAMSHPPPRDDHLDLLALDRARAGDATAAERAHLDACAPCREAVEGLHAFARGVKEAAPRASSPPEVNARVLAAARAAITGSGRAARQTRTAPAWRGMAAAAAILVGGAAIYWGVTRDARVPALVDPRDVDRSGRVDILDAYVLALHVRDRAGIEATWDIDGDGAVGSKDVDLVAMASVSLGKGAVR
jgi:hypothetical protein